MDRKLKLRVINKLLDAGYDDEKKVMGFGMKDMLVVDVRGEEIGAVLELQEATRTHKVISYLAGGRDETPEPESNEAGEKTEDTTEENEGGSEHERYFI